MTTEQKRTKEKELWDKFGVRITYKNKDIEPYDKNKTGCRFAIVDAKNKSNVLHFYERNGFKTLFPREIDEDFYTRPPKDENERAERKINPRKLHTRLMFCDLLDEE